MNGSVRPTRTELQLLKNAVIPTVRADPEPGDLLILNKPEGPVSEGHADRVNGVAIVNLLEVKARMPGVLAEQPIRFPASSLDLRRQLAVRRPEARPVTAASAGCLELMIGDEEMTPCSPRDVGSCSGRV